MTELLMIVNPDLGIDFPIYPKDDPVWIVDSKDNAPLVRIFRSLGYSVTTYSCPDVEDRLANLESMLASVELHHGIPVGNDVRFQRGTKVDVLGIGLSAEVCGALAKFGLAVIDSSPERVRTISVEES